MEYLSENEKTALKELIVYAREVTNNSIRHILIGSKARGDFKDTSEEIRKANK